MLGKCVYAALSCGGLLCVSVMYVCYVCMYALCACYVCMYDVHVGM